MHLLTFTQFSSNHLRHLLCGVLVSSSLICATSVFAQSTQRWINAAQVNLRGQPALDAPVLTRLPLAAVVQWVGLSSNPAFCEIEAGTERGFVACQFLSDQPVAAASTTTTAGQGRWVTGAGVNLRAQPDLNAAVLTRMALNSPVQLITTLADRKFCEVEVGSAGQPVIRGFTACQYLGTEQLAVKKISEANLVNGETNPNYNPEKAFWLSPKPEHMLAYGEFLEKTKLTPAMKADDLSHRGPFEGKPQKNLNRPAVPEFDAMKARLAQGFLFPTNKNLLKSWSEWLPPQDRGFDLVKSAVRLPAIEPSYFKNHAQLSPLESADMASSKWSIPLLATFQKGPRWVSGGHYGEPYVKGVWDIGPVSLGLSKGVQKNSLLRNGKIQTITTKLRPKNTLWDTSDDIDGTGCENFDYGFTMSESTAVLKQQKDGTETLDKSSLSRGNPAMIKFLTLDPIEHPQASVVRIESKHSLAATGYDSSVIWHFDIDGDGIPDVAVWEGTSAVEANYLSGMKTLFPHTRIYFFNIAGKWFVAGIDDFGFGCGC